jgi:hypothetical protein
MYNYTKKKLTENITCYKYNNKFDNKNIELFRKCYDNWFKIDINYIIKLKEVISNLSDHNFDIKGYKLDNMILLFNNIKTKYYILLFDNNIELYILDINFK